MNWPKRGGARVLFHQIFSLLWKAGRLVVNYLVRITFTRRWIINLLSFFSLLLPLSTVDPNEPGQQDAEQRGFHTQPWSAAQRRSCSPAGSLRNTAVQQRRVSPACGIQQAAPLQLKQVFQAYSAAPLDGSDRCRLIFIRPLKWHL